MQDSGNKRLISLSILCALERNPHVVGFCIRRDKGVIIFHKAESVKTDPNTAPELMRKTLGRTFPLLKWFLEDRSPVEPLRGKEGNMTYLFMPAEEGMQKPIA